MSVIQHVSPRTASFLEASKIDVSMPKEHMLQLDAVPVGADFSKTHTNAMLCRRHGQPHWEFFVDHDLAYNGDDLSRCHQFAGQRLHQWLALIPTEPADGDVNEAIITLLECLDSPHRHLFDRNPEASATASRPASESQNELERFGALLDLDQIREATAEPTISQAEVIDRIGQTITRTAAPNCPLVYGPSGSGKSMVAGMAAAKLINRGLADRALLISGAAICAGTIFWPQKDDRLQRSLQAVWEVGRTLIVLEQFDMVLSRTDAIGPLVAGWLDRGLHVIGVSEPDFSPDKIERYPALDRRIEKVWLGPPELAEVKSIILQRLAHHPLAESIEVGPEVISAVVTASADRPGANPGVALGLLEAVLSQAAWSGTELVGPDDLFHLVDCLEE